MPPLHSGDPGDGHGEDDHDEDDVAYVPPLPPEDRLWRHPSEVAMDRAPAPAPAAADKVGAGWSLRRAAPLMLLSGMVGATLAVGAVAVLGGVGERVVEREVAVRSATAPDDDPGAVEELAARTAPSVAALRVHRGTEVTSGSAVVLREDGYLLTDASVIADAESVDVMVRGRALGAASVVGVDPATGIAVLHVPVDDLDPAALGDSSALTVGARTVVVGAVADGGWDAAVATGVVSAMGRRLDADGGRDRYGMILLDTHVASGSAGGALVDGTGAVVGIASSSPDDEETTFGVAIPIALARHVAEQLMADGQVRHVWLGLHGTDLDAAEAAALELSGGARVADVVEGGPADLAGIQVGDVVVAVDDDPTPSMAALIDRLQLHVPGDVVVLGVQRDGEDRTVSVTLAEKPRDP